MINMLKITFFEFTAEVRKIYFIMLTQPGWFSVPIMFYSLFWLSTVGVLLHVVSLAFAVLSITTSGIRDMLSPNVSIGILPDPISFAHELRAFRDKHENKKEVRS